MARTDNFRGKSDTGPKAVEIGVLVYPGAQTSAVGGLTDLFVTANRLSTERNAAGSRILRVTHWALPPGGAQFECVYDTHGGDHEALVALILPPSLEFDGYGGSDGLHENWIREQHAGGAVVCSICAGAFLLGGTGLLSGRPATTHWIHAASLADRFPEIRVMPDKLIIDDGDIITAGGVMAWIDLGLRLIHRWISPAVMMATARFFLVDAARREQRFYSTFAPRMHHGDEIVRRIQHWLQIHYAVNATVNTLADRAGLGERTFLRRFSNATGLTPTEYLQQLRVEKAREALEFSMQTVGEIALLVGYQDEGAFRRIFRRITGLAPGDYRKRFSVSDEARAPAGKRNAPGCRETDPATLKSGA
jgi:transcriptional regulator GlxA family with amidase domain